MAVFFLGLEVSPASAMRDGWERGGRTGKGGRLYSYTTSMAGAVKALTRREGGRASEQSGRGRGPGRGPGTGPPSPRGPPRNAPVW